MNLPEPLATLFERQAGGVPPLPLPDRLAMLYGELTFPAPPDRPYVISNFVSTLDGVVALGVPGTGGKEISGDDAHDRVVMGLLRAMADAVVVGAGVLRASPTHLWTAEYVFPSLTEEYRQLRAALGKQGPPLNVVVSGSGVLDLTLPVFTSDAAPALIITTEVGRRRLDTGEIPSSVSIIAAAERGAIAPGDILATIGTIRRCDRILSEAGPRLFGQFLGAGAVDELFLTLAPQVAGRSSTTERPGLVAGIEFAPGASRWGELRSVKRGGSHLFLRYALPR